MKIFVLAIFILMYVFIIALPKHKMLSTGIAALITSVALIISGEFKVLEPLGNIKLDVIFMLVGIMVTVGMFAESKMPNKLADQIIAKMPNSLWALVFLAVLSGLISAVVDNVATVLMLAPIGLAVARKIKVSPIPVIISIAVSSNLQGAATLVGDTTSIMLGDAMGMNFFDFFFMDGKFSIFWAVELGMLFTIPVIIFIFRKENKKLEFQLEEVKVTTITPTIILLVNFALLVISSFFTFSININGMDVTKGLICVVCGLISLITYTCSQKNKLWNNVKSSIDHETIFFLIFLFVIIGCVEKVGIIYDLGQAFSKIGSKNIFLLYTLIVFGSVLFSAFIDNIPYVATMLPVINVLSATLPPQYATVLYFGLLIGATLGGNLTTFGASANIVGIGILRKEGYDVKNADFFKIGIPFTMVAVLAGYLFCWFVWGI